MELTKNKMNTIYIKSNSDGIPLTDWLAWAYYGFNQLGNKIILFEDIMEVPLSKEHIVISDIDDTICYFKRLEIDIPPALNIPYHLLSYQFVGRHVETNLSLDGLKEYVANGYFQFPFFIKPQRLKAFESGVISTESSLEYIENNFPNEKIIASQYKHFESEFRCSIYDNKIVGIHFYQGNCQVLPDVEAILKMVNAFKLNSPIAYTLDVGVCLDSNLQMKTFLVECNDFWSIGNYGLEPIVYAKMLRDRWDEIV